MTKILGGLSAALFLCSCGGGSSPGAPTPTPSPNLLSVGGTYVVAVVLGANSCGAVTVAPQPTSVTHAPGANRFTLVHGVNSFAGSVVADGTFNTDPLALNDGATALTVTLQGRFSTTGLTAAVTVDVRPPGSPPCQYTVAWTGQKQGPPNVIP